MMQILRSKVEAYRPIEFTRISDSAPAPTGDGSREWWLEFLRGAELPSAATAPALNVVDLFCGAGGFGLGASIAARSAGYRAHFSRIVDVDRDALAVYSKNLSVGRGFDSPVSSLVDYQIRRRGGRARFVYSPEIIDETFNLNEPPDLLIGGPPCQGHSNLNNYTRRSDPRNELLFCSIAVGVALKAKAIVLENVRSILNADRDLVATAVQLLQSEGYDFVDDKTVLKADELGWPQTRSRFFLSALHRDSTCAEFAGFGSIEKRNAESVIWAIGDLEELQHRAPVFDEPPKATAETQRRIDWFEQDLSRRELDNSERPDCHKNGTSYKSVYGRMYPERPAPTITTGFGTPGQGRFIHPTRPRLITPHEAARIQGFPDSFRFFEPGEQPTRSNLAKWIGDAVPSILGFTAIRRVLDAMELP